MITSEQAQWHRQTAIGQAVEALAALADDEDRRIVAKTLELVPVP